MSEPKKPRRGRPRSVNRDHAVRIAMENYWRDGLFAFSLNELCRRAGLSKPALYREFGGEDGLMEAALLHYRQEVVLPVLALVADDQPFPQVLDQLIAAITTHHGLPAGCLFTAMRLARPRLGPATADRILAIIDERRSGFADRYRRALDHGEANPDHPPEHAARYLDTQLTTAFVQMGAGEPPDEVRTHALLAFQVLLPS